MFNYTMGTYEMKREIVNFSKRIVTIHSLINSLSTIMYNLGTKIKDFILYFFALSTE